MSDTAHEKDKRRAAYEAERIRMVLRRAGARDYNPSIEDDHYQGGFAVEAHKPGGPHSVGGFHIDPFGVWPPKMREHAKTLRDHGYQVEVQDHYDGEILHVTPPPPPEPFGAWLRSLFGRRPAA